MALFDDTRADWGARAPKRAATAVAPSRRTEFFVHYDGGSPVNVAGHADCLARVRQDQTYHMDSNGWSDIGYNGLVCQHGRAIEGRGIDYVGAHCPDHNTSGYGFQFMVGGQQAPTDAAKARMARLYTDCASRSGHALAKKGHRDGFATACPGDLIYAWVKAGMPGATTTTVQEDVVTPDDIKAIAKAVADEAWTRPVDDGKGGRPTTGAAIGLILRNSIAALTEDRAGRAALLAAVKAGQDAGPQADADAIVDALAARLATKETTP